jgi:glycosyltransferase involved in cell wall biosynthesis
MNLVVFSPLVPASAIGRVTELVTRELVDQGHRVTLVRAEDVAHLASPARPLDTPVIRWDERRAVLAAVSAADGVVYQVGDNHDFHRGCVEWLPSVPGIVCLHDYFVGNLFRAWSRARPDEAAAIVREWYGEAIARRYFSYQDAVTLVRNTAADAPMTEWISSMASAVVTHSSWGIARVLAACPGPVRVVPLPYDAPAITTRTPRADVSAPETATTAGAAALEILTIGLVNPNKRVESVVRAIADSDRLRTVARYRLIGPIDTETATGLRSLADELEVDLVISGELDDDALRVAIDQSDVVCALRLPALEAASASAIEAMLYGKPVVVMDTGFFQELPDEYVRKVAPEREVDDLRRILEELHADPDGRRALGEAAAAWASRTFRADEYAASLTELVVAAAAATPVIEMTRYYARILAAWGASARQEAVPALVEPLRMLER